MKQSPRICDYEGSPYRRVFWEDADRSYEDAAERLAVRAFLPPSGRRVVDIGGGFGRLVNEYAGYEQVVLLDYARTMLADARERLGDRCTYVCADLYHLPFATGAIDSAVQVRVLHHVERVEDAFAEVARALRADGTYVLEFANKRNLKALVRHLAGRHPANPLDPQPYEFISLNWNFHPRHIDRALAEAGFVAERRRAVSHFRVPALKRLVPPQPLARLDAAIGTPLAGLTLAPSQFVSARRHGGAPPSDPLWRCPACGHEPLAAEPHAVPCPACGREWPIIDGVHVFRES